MKGTSVNHGTQLGTLFTAMTDAHDDLFGHTHRVAEMAGRLATELGLPERTVEEIRLAAQLHDVGKLHVDRAVWAKPGPLNRTERAEMCRHPEIGYRMIKGLVPRTVADAVRHHHERWDGAGYPSKLAGSDIPIASRIIQVADTFDAMTSTRCYQPAIDPARVMDEIARNRGTQFDPIIAGVFLGQLARDEMVLAA